MYKPNEDQGSPTRHPSPERRTEGEEPGGLAGEKGRKRSRLPFRLIYCSRAGGEKEDGSRKEKIGDKSFDPLVIDDFDWGNEWVDPTIPPPQGARGCPDDISWDLVDEAVGASSAMRGRYFPRATTTTIQRGPSNVNVPYQRQRKRPAPSPLESDHEYDQEGDEGEGQHSTIPNGEDDDSDVQDDVDVTDDDEYPTSDHDGEDDANATVDEFDDGGYA